MDRDERERIERAIRTHDGPLIGYGGIRTVDGDPRIESMQCQATDCTATAMELREEAMLFLCQEHYETRGGPN
jgi:hypothetical protein